MIISYNNVSVKKITFVIYSCKHDNLKTLILQKYQIAHFGCPMSLHVYIVFVLIVLCYYLGLFSFKIFLNNDIICVKK